MNREQAFITIKEKQNPQSKALSTERTNNNINVSQLN